MDALHGMAGCTLSSCLSRALPAFLCSIFSNLGTEPKASNPLGAAPLSLRLGPPAYPIPQLTHHDLQPRGQPHLPLITAHILPLPMPPNPKLGFLDPSLEALLLRSSSGLKGPRGIWHVTSGAFVTGTTKEPHRLCEYLNFLPKLLCDRNWVQCVGRWSHSLQP